jgi:hypothetical protein
MSLKQYLMSGDTSVEAQKMAYLIKMVKELGWDSLMDPRAIKPCLRKAQVYIRNHEILFSELFGENFKKIKKEDLVDVINPHLVHIWHIQIVGDYKSAALELLRPNTENNVDNVDIANNAMKS